MCATSVVENCGRKDKEKFPRHVYIALRWTSVVSTLVVNHREQAGVKV